MCCLGAMVMTELAGNGNDSGRVEPPRRRGERELTGRTVLIWLLAFFGVVTAVNATMMTLAIRSMPGVDVKSAYEASQKYNEEIARAHEQDARGWKADVSLGKTGDGRDIVLKIRDKSGEPVRGLAMQVRLAHPADRKADRTAQLKEIAPGVYAAGIAHVHPGAWDIVFEGREDNREVFQSRSRIRL